MLPLASAEDFAVRGLDAPDWTGAALAAVSAAVREAAQSPILAETCTVTVMGGRGCWLDVPTPVSAVTAVTVDGDAVTGWKAFPHALWHEGGWGDYPSLVAVTGTFGATEVPADIVALVVDLTVLASASGAVDPRATSESIDDYRVTFDGGTVSAVELPPRTREMLRSRFGSSAVVTGIR